MASQLLSELDHAQESNRLLRSPRQDKTWLGEVYHLQMEVITCLQAHAGDCDDLLVYLFHSSSSYYNNEYIS